MSDKDFVDFGRQYCPDSAMLLLHNGIDLGALGYGDRGTAILKRRDSTKNLESFALSNQFDQIRWTGIKTVSASLIPSPL